MHVFKLANAVWLKWKIENGKWKIVLRFIKKIHLILNICLFENSRVQFFAPKTEKRWEPLTLFPPYEIYKMKILKQFSTFNFLFIKLVFQPIFPTLIFGHILSTNQSTHPNHRQLLSKR